MLRQIELNTCIHRHLPLYDFSHIGLFYKSHGYKTKRNGYFGMKTERFSKKNNASTMVKCQKKQSQIYGIKRFLFCSVLIVVLIQKIEFQSSIMIKN